MKKPIQIVTPQFTRLENEPKPAQAPSGKAGFDALHNLSETALHRLGMRRWGRDDGEYRREGQATGKVLWVFPGEWYDSIPEGYPLVSIFYETKLFQKGKTDDDIRFGCLAYGILR